MHIKNIHSMVEKLTECAKVELDKGIEKIDTEEMSKVAEIIKELCEAEYYATVTKAMEEHDFEDEEEIMDEGRRGYRGQPRSQSGRFMSRGDGRRSNRGRGGRRGYESQMMYDDWDEMQRMSDFEDGRMYYGGSGSSSGGNTSNMGGASSGMNSGSSNTGSRGYSEGGQMSSRMQRDGREGRSGESRRGYMESKEQGKDKSEKMQNLEEYAKTLTEDVTEMVQGMSPEEKALLKNKMQTLMTKIQ